MRLHKKKGQIGIEYLIIIGFVTFVILGIMGVAFFYSGNINDRIRLSQINTFANKVISASESVFYSGTPSKSTISAYLPDGVNEVEIIDNSIVFTVQTSSGINRVSFSSNVPISGAITSSPGLKKLQIVAEQDIVVIS